jgi:glutaredoxin
LKAWADSLGKISYPLLSDFYPHGQVAQTYGVLRPDGTSERAIFIVDKNCTIRYVDVHDIDEQPDNEVLFRELARVEGVPVPPPVSMEIGDPTNPSGKIESAPKPAVFSPGEQPKVIMYCTAWCPACRRARAYLKMHDIEFEEIDITRDRAAASRVREWANGNETTPTFDIGGTILVNFNITRLNEVLGIQE